MPGAPEALTVYQLPPLEDERLERAPSITKGASGSACSPLFSSAMISLAGRSSIADALQD